MIVLFLDGCADLAHGAANVFSHLKLKPSFEQKQCQVKLGKVTRCTFSLKDGGVVMSACKNDSAGSIQTIQQLDVKQSKNQVNPEDSKPCHCFREALAAQCQTATTNDFFSSSGPDRDILFSFWHSIWDSIWHIF